MNAEEDCTYYPVIFDPELEEVTFYFCYSVDPSTEYDTTTLWLLQLFKTYGDILTTDKVGLPLSKHQADLYIQQIPLLPPFN